MKFIPVFLIAVFILSSSVSAQLGDIGKMLEGLKKGDQEQKVKKILDEKKNKIATAIKSGKCEDVLASAIILGHWGECKVEWYRDLGKDGTYEQKNEKEWYGETFRLCADKLYDCGNLGFILTNYVAAFTINGFSYATSDLLKELYEKKNQKDFESKMVAFLGTQEKTYDGSQVIQKVIYWLRDNKNTSHEKEVLALLDRPLFPDTCIIVLNFLDSIGQAPSAAKLISYLSDDHAGVRRCAVDFLGKLKVKEAVEKLKIVSQNDPAFSVDANGYKIYNVRDAAKAAIQKILLAN